MGARSLATCAVAISIIMPMLAGRSFARALPLPVDVALQAQGVAGRVPIAISPDGKLIAFTLDRTSVKEPMAPGSLYFSNSGVMEEAFGTDLLVADTAGGKTIDLGAGSFSTTAPAWSPDGKFLAFVSDREGLNRIWLWNRATQTSRRASEAIAFSFFTFEIPRWLPDSRHLIFKTLPEGKSLAETIALSNAATISKPVPERAVSTPRVYSFDPSHKTVEVADATSNNTPPPWMLRELGDLALLDIGTGEVKRFATGVNPLGWAPSPNGTQIAYTTLRGLGSATSQQPLHDLVVYDRPSGKSVVVGTAKPMDYGISFSWSPDGKRLAFSTSGVDTLAETKRDEFTHGDVYVATVDGNAPVNLTPGDHPSFHNEQRGPVWTKDGAAVIVASGSSLYRITPGVGPRKLAELPGEEIRGVLGTPLSGDYFSDDDGRSMYLIVRSSATKSEGIARVDVTSGAASPVFDAPLRIADPTMAADAIAGTAVFVAEDVRYGQQVYVARGAFARRRALYRVNPQLTQYSLGTSRLLNYTTAEGKHLQAALLLPANYVRGRRYPLVVRVYGGEMESGSVNRFGFEGAGPDNMQILASRGYAVLEPDAPLREGQPLKDLALSVMPAIDRAIAVGIADPSRLAVEGHSYGGYSTLALIVQSTRFKAAVDSAGPADLLSQYFEFVNGESWAIGWAEEGQGRMRGTPWQYFQRYADNSPLYLLDRVQTPLLIVHGDADEAVPIAQTDAVFVGLRRLGKPVTYVVYPGEDHWQGTWKLEHILDYWDRVLAFLGAQLKP